MAIETEIGTDPHHHFHSGHESALLTIPVSACLSCRPGCGATVVVATTRSRPFRSTGPIRPIGGGSSARTGIRVGRGRTATSSVGVVPTPPSRRRPSHQSTTTCSINGVGAGPLGCGGAGLSAQSKPHVATLSTISLLTVCQPQAVKRWLVKQRVRRPTRGFRRTGTNSSTSSPGVRTKVTRRSATSTPGISRSTRRPGASGGYYDKPADGDLTARQDPHLAKLTVDDDA